MSTELEPKRRAHRRNRALFAGVAAVAVALSGCTIPTAADEALAVTSMAPTSSAVPVDTPIEVTSALEPPSRDGFAKSFETFSADVDGAVGIAIQPVGGRMAGRDAASSESLVEGSVQSAGDWTSGAAWSTSKVPLAIAALNSPGGQGMGGQGLGGAAHSAITASDNAAAEELWAALGPPDQAALEVEGVLQEFGDLATIVPAARARPEFSIFGQMGWSLSDQARFGAALPCAPKASEVYSLMGQVSGDQSWGLGTIPGAHFKGGWGPGLAGGYLVRQFGVIDTPTGGLAVAIAAETPTGSFADGMMLLGQVAQWIKANPDLLPIGGGC